MKPSSVLALRFRAAALALALLSLSRPVLAHGQHHHGHANDTMPDKVDSPPTYFAHPDHAGLIYAHIVLMALAWVFVLPVAVMLSLARSRHTLALQFAFLAINALGLLLATVYNAQTPDLYPNNAHHKIGWIVTWVVSAQVLVRLVGRVSGRVSGPVGHGRHARSSSEMRAFIPVRAARRMSNDSGQGTEPNTESLRSNSISTIGGAGDDDDDDDDYDDGHDDTHSPHKDYGPGDEEHQFEALHAPASPSRLAGALAARAVSSRLFKYVGVSCRVVDRIILPFGFVALTTGIATFGRFFEGPAVFSGLAHWIKGGVFFWLGLVTLGRWSGSFGDLGWAWNVRPPARHHRWRPSAEFVESALILLYGTTNIFLEHLGAWGGEWSAQDLEHLAITVLFIGGGLCGMLVESARVRDLLNAAVSDADADAALPDGQRLQHKAPATYGFSLNPIPALVILLLGVMMSSHQQESVISNMVHRQWGNLLLSASLARALTYVLVFLRPPKSVLPSRPPTELLAAFGLIAGGIIFMASSSDTIEGMVHYRLDAMFTYTVTMGLVGILMAWELVVLALKGWASRRERRLESRKLP